MATHASTNSHFSFDYRTERKPDLSSQINHMGSHNHALTRERDLDRYRTAFSDRTNIYDNARTTAPTNYFGTKFIRDWDRTPHYSPAGMDMVNSTVQTGKAFTKTFVPNFNVI